MLVKMLRKKYIYIYTNVPNRLNVNLKIGIPTSLK